jgi:hypothetical protein
MSSTAGSTLDAMRRREGTIVAGAIVMAACARETSPRTVTAPSQETAAPSSSVAPAALPAASPAAGTNAPLPHPQSDPMPPPAPRCPSVAALVKASAVVKREPPRRGQPSPAPVILDIELTVLLPTNATQVTLAQNHPTVYGGVLVEQPLPSADPTKSVVLIRPYGAVARDGSLLAMYGVVCTAAQGSVRVEMRFVSPLHDGDKVTVRLVDDY